MEGQSCNVRVTRASDYDQQILSDKIYTKSQIISYITAIEGSSKSNSTPLQIKYEVILYQRSNVICVTKDTFAVVGSMFILRCNKVVMVALKSLVNRLSVFLFLITSVQFTFKKQCLSHVEPVCCQVQLISLDFSSGL